MGPPGMYPGMPPPQWGYGAPMGAQAGPPMGMMPGRHAMSMAALPAQPGTWAGPGIPAGTSTLSKQQHSASTGQLRPLAAGWVGDEAETPRRHQVPMPAAGFG